MTEAMGWLLTVESFGASIGWSLLVNDGETKLVKTGILDDISRLRETAHRLSPTLGAGSDTRGRGGLWASALTRADEERAAAEVLGEALLPAQLRSALLSRGPRIVDTVTVATRGWLAAIPWDLLALERGGPRLLEHAHVLGGLSPVITGTRARTSLPEDRARPGLCVIDPGPLSGPVGSLYPNGYPERLVQQLRDAGDDYIAAQEGLDADRLAYQLNRAPSRLLYLGHVRPGRPESPAAAALVLRGPAIDVPTMFTARQWLSAPQTWPCPARVALIGCASDDSVIFEQSGLVVAAVNAGAQLVTSTRWPLPTDHPAPWNPAPAQPVNHEGLTDLAVATHRAHQKPRPVHELRQWQLERLHQWRQSALLADSPLLWASTVTYATPTPGDRRTSR